MENSQIQELKQRLAEINDVRSAASVLNWDQMTYMPPGGAEARGRQVATLEQIAHEKLTHPSIGRMLTELRSHERTFPADSDEAALIRVARRSYDHEVKVSPLIVDAH